MAEHHGRYLSAGAEAVVTKPVDWNELNVALARFAGGAAAREEPVSPVHAIADLVLDESVLAALEEALGKDALAPLLAGFARSLIEYRTRLRDTVTAADIKAAKKIAHALRGLAAQFGAAGITAAATRIATEALSNEQIAALADQIFTLSDEVLALLEKRAA